MKLQGDTPRVLAVTLVTVTTALNAVARGGDKHIHASTDTDAAIAYLRQRHRGEFLVADISLVGSFDA